MKKTTIMAFILFVSLLILNGCSSKEPFSLGEIHILDDDIAEFNENQEINILKEFENKGRFVNLDIPIQRKIEIKNIKANMQCSIEGAQLFDSLGEEGNNYVFKSYYYRDLNFYVEGHAGFFGRGTVLNKGSTKGTEILLLKKKGLAYFSLDLNFKGEESKKVICLIDIISKDPPHVASKTIIFNYPGIKGFSVLNN